MFRFFGLICGVALLQGCGREESPDVSVPAFAAKLPGHVAIVMYSLTADLPLGLTESMTESLPEGTGFGQFVSFGSKVCYLDMPGAQTGWETLAQSTNFAQALAVAPQDTDILVYLDLQLIAANIWREAGGEISVQLRRLTDALYLDDFQFLIAGVKEQADDSYSMAGSIQTSGAAVGIAGLFPDAAGTMSLLGGESFDDLLNIEVRIDTGAAQRIIGDFTSRQGQDLIASMINAAVFPMLKIAKNALGLLNGRVSLRIDSSRDWGFAAKVDDVDALMDLLDRHFREESGDVWVLRDGLSVQMRGDILCTGPLAAQLPFADAGQRPSAFSVHTALDGTNYEFSLAPGTERFEFVFKRGR